MAVSRWAARRTSSSRSRARRLGSPVRSSWRAMYSVRSSASMRAWSWTSMEAMACRALISSGVQACEPEVEEAQDAPGGVRQEQGHARATDPFGTPSPCSTRSMYSSGWYVDAGKVRLAEVLRRGEHRVGVEGHFPERIGVGDARGAATPLRGCSGPAGDRCGAGRPHRRRGTRPARGSSRSAPPARLRDDADISRSATWPTSSSRRRWSSSALSREARVTVWLKRPPKALVRARSRLDQARPWRATTRAPMTSPSWSGDGLDQDTPGHARDDAGEGADRRSGHRAGSPTRLRMWTRACSEPGIDHDSASKPGYLLVEAAHDVDDLRAGDDLRYRLDDETSLQVGHAGRNVGQSCHIGTPPSRVHSGIVAFPRHLYLTTSIAQPLDAGEVSPAIPYAA